MLPEYFYLTGAGWLGFLICIPIALSLAGLIYWLLLRRMSIKWLRFSILGILSFSLVTMPLWETLSISYEAERLCKEQGGLHVYKMVETDGLIAISSEYWLKHGFSYVENGGGKYMGRETIKDGKVTRENITEYKSRYQVEVGGSGKKINSRIRRLNSPRVKDRKTGEILGELVKFKIYPSAFDVFSLSLLPVEYNPWVCGNEAPMGKGSYSPGIKKYLYGSSDVVKATLKPVNQFREEGK